MDLYHSLSLASFNLQLLAPECSITINYEDRWLVTAALPLILVGAVLVVVAATRCLQCVQRNVLHTLPFGATSDTSLTDTCIGILISGNYYLYFRTCVVDVVVGYYMFRAFCQELLQCYDAFMLVFAITLLMVFHLLGLCRRSFDCHVLLRLSSLMLCR